MRKLGCLFTFLLIAAAVLIAGDQLVTATAESRTAARTGSALDAEVDVDLEGWPVTLHMLNGSIPQATLAATDVPLDNGASLDRLDVVLTDVEVNVSDLTGDAENLPDAGTATFEAELDESSVAAMLGIPGGIAEVTLESDTVTISAAGIAVAADVEARDGDIIVSLAGPLAQLLGGAEFPIDLSNTPGAPAVEDVEIRNGVMHVSGSLEDLGG